jgi:hypothetical protein
LRNVSSGLEIAPACSNSPRLRPINVRLIDCRVGRHSFAEQIRHSWKKKCPRRREAGGILLNAISHRGYRRISLLDCFEERHDRADYPEDRARYSIVPIERFRSLIKIAGITHRIATATPYGVHAGDFTDNHPQMSRNARTLASSDIVSRR